MMSLPVAIVVYALLLLATLTELVIFALVVGELIEEARSRMPKTWRDRRDERLRVERAIREMARVRREAIAEMDRVVQQHQQTRRPVRRPKGTRPRPRPSDPAIVGKEKVNKRIVG